MSIHIRTNLQKINDFLPDERNFTKQLAHIADVPKRLWCIGDLPSTPVPTVAIIGSRRPTTYGHDITYRLAYDLAKKGVVIVSGLAIGIDSLAHQAALEAGGRTIAVMPCGLDQIYPRRHYQLAAQIVEQGGALISEYPPGQTIYQSNFIGRNRLVSGISHGVVIVEASAKSGTMHTANFALDQGKPVMAVPGNATSPNSEGCHNLIKRGACLVTSCEDVLNELGLTAAPAQHRLPLGDSPEESAILKSLAGGLSDGEQLQAASGLSAASFAQALSLLEITGQIRPLGANQWSIK